MHDSCLTITGCAYSSDNPLLSYEIVRGCSYGGELVRLGGLTHLGKISPSLRNSYKNVILPGSHLDEMKIFHLNTRKWVVNKTGNDHKPL